MDPNELLARYEALGEERDFLAAKRLFEQAAAGTSDARLLNGYGYLLECHARNELRQAVALYERAIERDPSYDKPHYQLISARAGLREPEQAIATYEGDWRNPRARCASIASSHRPTSWRTTTPGRWRSWRRVSRSPPTTPR